MTAKKTTAATKKAVTAKKITAAAKKAVAAKKPVVRRPRKIAEAAAPVPEAVTTSEPVAIENQQAEPETSLT